jgi:hypothetical protein
VRSNAARIGLLAALAAVAAVLFIVLSGGDESNNGNSGASTATTGGTSSGLAVIKIANGAPVGGIRDLEYSEGDQVRLKVFPEPDMVEIHVHGYEIEKETSGTTPVAISFPATISGGFEVEAHTANDEFQIADLKVNP